MSEVATCLANGPSAKEVIENKRGLIQSTDILVVNNFVLAPEFLELKPKYYVILDPMYFIEGFSVVHEEGKDEQIVRVKKNNEKVRSILLNVDWKLNVLIPSHKGANKFASIIKDNPQIRVIRYNATRIAGFKKFQEFCFSKGWGLPSSKNVVIPALINLINIGYKEIFLYGVEMSWTKTMNIDEETGLMYFKDDHSYGKGKIRCFNKGAYCWWLKNISEMLCALDVISYYAQYKKVRIVNRTKYSFVDSFEYENPDKLTNYV